MRLEIRFYRKQELVDEDFLECGDVVLFVEHKHGFLVVDGVDRAEGYGAIAVGNKDGIACYACRPFVAVGECLYIRKEYQGEEGFLKYVLLSVD